MNKLTRKDLGLDVEAFKDYCSNLKMFAKYDYEYQLLDNESPHKVEGALGTMFETDANRDNIFFDKRAADVELKEKSVKNRCR